MFCNKFSGSACKRVVSKNTKSIPTYYRTADIDIVKNNNGSYDYNSYLISGENKTLISVTSANNSATQIEVPLSFVSFDKNMSNLAITNISASYTSIFKVVLHQLDKKGKTVLIIKYTVRPASGTKLIDKINTQTG